MRMLQTPLAACLALMMGSTVVSAQESLYAETPPDDALFVRVVAPADAMPSRVALAGVDLTVADAVGTDYMAVSAERIEPTLAGTYHTIVMAADGTAVQITEPARVGASKVHLILINAAAEPVRVIVPGKGMEVVAPVAGAEAAMRAVNPVAAELAVERMSDGAVLGSFDLRLRRGQDVSFVVTDAGVELVEHRFGPVLHLD